MLEKVYIETSVISYLTSRPSRDVVIAGHQQTTHDWWETQRQQFALIASQLVIQEASAGNSVFVQKRLEALKGIPLLATNEAALNLAQVLVKQGPMPQKATADALHIAIAVTNGVEYLLTWNCKHMANANMRSQVERLCRIQGYEPTVICPPTNSGKMLRNDPIVDEVRQVRERYLASFDYNLQALFDDLKHQEAQSDMDFVSYPARSIIATKLAQ